ncbi:TlpA disulfide reductase family protein [Lutibacter sp.]|uniref:TlpA family protein disulfide reductase n=1 Tax=Lutibacter sp. TaxID=1925666 RepID=UPI0025C4E90D|nr:TlpA disulfide reductase family protein [Lutibacter sp.]MCF6182342.1 TlpA family protein disulfide reductase [Lutibacter sp.]
MKKIWILLAVLSLFSCKKEVKKDYSVVSGKITDKLSDSITLYNSGRTYTKTITLKNDGSFVDTLKIEEGHYWLNDGENKIPLYIKNGDDVQIKYNVNSFEKTFKITGKGSKISEYLSQKHKIEQKIIAKGTAVYLLNENNYEAVFHKEKDKLITLITNFKGISQSFKDREKRNIEYAYFNYINRYQRYHEHYAKLPDFKVSEHFLDDLKDIIYSDEGDFKFSKAYRTLVTNFYSEQASVLAKKDSISESLAFLKVSSDIPTKIIKNNLLFNDAKYGITYTENLEEYYKSFMEASTNKKQKEEITKSYNKLKALSEGQPSPKFKNYENYNGETTSLEDLKGKYVYIDVWATWCGPCKAEIPFLKTIEKKYHNKNITFVSISVDKVKDHNKWLKMVKEKEMKGYQLFADNNWNSDFVKNYLIFGIPRFILIDPKGNIVNSNAPRPSDDRLEQLFKSLKI